MSIPRQHTLTDPTVESDSNGESRRDPLADRLLRPVPLQPYDHDERLTDEALALLEAAIDGAIEVAKGTDAGIPDDVIKQAVFSNYRERFARTRKALGGFYDYMEASPGWRHFFEQHEHSTPDSALKFFEENPALPAYDICAALCGHDDFSIARAIQGPEERGNFWQMNVVNDDLPHLKYEVMRSDIDGGTYAIITSKKIIGIDDLSYHRYKLKRRKTYAVPIENLWDMSLIKPSEEGGGIDIEALAELLQAADITPDFLHPVIESAYVDRAAALKDKDYQAWLSKELDRRYIGDGDRNH